MITLTVPAALKILDNLTKRGGGIGIRIGIRTTGCSGLAYVLEYVDEVQVGDIVTTNNHITVVVDKKSATIVDGMTVDYVRQGLNEGFEFINPNEKDRCGCNESFRI